MPGFPGENRVRYSGLFPVAEAEYLCADLPVRMAVTAFSPLVPHDVARSNFPGALFLFKFRNLLPVKIHLRLFVSWENTLGCGGPVEGRTDCNRTGNMIAPFNDRACRGLVCKTAGKSGKVYPNSLGEYALITPCDRRPDFSTYAWNALHDREKLLLDHHFVAWLPHGDALPGKAGQVHELAGGLVRPQCLAGFHADESERSIILGPVPGLARSLGRMPIMSSKYWAMLAVDARAEAIELRMVFHRLFDGVELKGPKLRGRCNVLSCRLNERELGRTPDEATPGYTGLRFSGSEPIGLRQDDELRIVYTAID